MEKKTHVIIASLILSILVWLSVSMNNEYSIAIRVPFRVSGLSQNIALANRIPRTVLVRVRGTGWQLASSNYVAATSIDYDVSNLEKKRIMLTSRELAYSLDLGSSAEVVSFTPDSILITLDTVIAKRVPIVSRVLAIPRDGFMVAREASVEPDSVTISGASKLLDGIDFWFTRPKEYKNVISSIDTRVPLVDSLSGLVTPDVSQAEVKIDIEQVTENTYKNIPITITSNPDSASILFLPPTVNVTIRGGIDMIADLTADSLKAIVSYRNLLASGSSWIEPHVTVPSGFEVIAVQPDSIEFVLRKSVPVARQRPLP